MRFVEDHDPERARRLLDDIRATATRPWAIMEVCGGCACAAYHLDRRLEVPAGV